MHNASDSGSAAGNLGSRRPVSHFLGEAVTPDYTRNAQILDASDMVESDHTRQWSYSPTWRDKCGLIPAISSGSRNYEAKRRDPHLECCHRRANLKQATWDVHMGTRRLSSCFLEPVSFIYRHAPWSRFTSTTWHLQ